MGGTGGHSDDFIKSLIKILRIVGRPDLARRFQKALVALGIGELGQSFWFGL
jgi:hypothetical protein